MADLKTVASYYDAMSARITAGMLNDNGIPAAVFGDNSSYVCLNYVKPVEVRVNPEDYDAAMQLLAQAETEMEAETPEDATSEEPETLKDAE